MDMNVQYILYIFYVSRKKLRILTNFIMDINVQNSYAGNHLKSIKKLTEFYIEILLTESHNF